MTIVRKTVLVSIRSIYKIVTGVTFPYYTSWPCPLASLTSYVYPMMEENPMDSSPSTHFALTASLLWFTLKMH